MSGQHLTRRRLLGGLCASAAGLLVAACGAPAPEPTKAPEKPAQPAQPAPTPTPQPAAKPTAAVTPVAATKPAAGEQVKIVFFTWGWAERFKVWRDDVVGGFNKAHPNIVAELLEGPSEYESKLLTMAAGGVAPDVFRLSQSYSIDVFAKGFCMELDSYLKRDSFVIEDYTSPPYAQCKYKGKWYGVPHGAAGNFVLWYNRDLFKAAGVPFPKDDWAWDDFVAAAKALTKDTNGDGKVDQWGTSSGIATGGAMPFAVIWSNGGEELTEDGKSFELDKPPAMEAQRLLVDLHLKHKVVPMPGEIPQGLGDIFLSGKVAMHYSGAWYEVTAKTAKFDFGIVLNPKMRAGQVAYAEQNVTSGYKGSKYPDACWAFLRHLISEENQKVESLSGLNGPSMPKILQSSEFQEVKGPPYSRKPIVPNLLCKTRGIPLIPQARKFRDAYRQKTGAVWTGERKLEEVIPEVVEAAKKIIAENA